MGRATATTDIFLPECLIHKILSYLSYEEANQMRILSKTWRQAWLTLPYLKFKFPVLYRKEINIVDKIMERYRDNKIPIVKFEFSGHLLIPDHEVFSFIDKWLDIALQHGVKHLLYKGNPSYPFPISKILASKSIRELILTRCNLMGVSSCGVLTNCNSLRKLSLSYVSLDDNMLQTLLTSCPLIEAFILDFCSELEKIELLNLQKIKSVSIRTLRNQLVKIQAPTVEHLSYCGRFEDRTMLDIVQCQSLKSLELSCMTISDEFIQHLFVRSQFLESLRLDFVYKGSERFNICGSQSLRVLKIKCCDRIEIDVPNLVSLECTGDHILELKIAKEPSQLKHSKIFLHCFDNLIAEWFCKLKKFLSNLTSWSQVFLYFSKCNGIGMKDLQLYHRVNTPQVDVLYVDIKWSILCPTFVDALLWSCHPKKLILSSTVEMITCFIDYIKNSSHSTSHGTKPWHSQLKEVKTYKFDLKNQPVELGSGELALRTHGEREKICFLLDW